MKMISLSLKVPNQSLEEAVFCPFESDLFIECFLHPESLGDISLFKVCEKNFSFFNSISLLTRMPKSSHSGLLETTRI